LTGWTVVILATNQPRRSVSRALTMSISGVSVSVVHGDRAVPGSRERFGLLVATAARRQKRDE
jgi:hypothetical protein